MAALLDRYDGVLLDAFGVLLDGRGVLPGASELLGELVRRGKPYAIVSNDASRSRTTFAARFAASGLAVPPDRIVSSGTLLPGYFANHRGARTCVLGTDDSAAFVEEGGGIVVDLREGMEIDAVAICDDGGTPFLDGMELALSAIVRAVRDGRRPILVCPNPDLVYPKAAGELGITAGAMAALLELSLDRVLPGSQLRFDHLGKPLPLLMRAAAEHIGVARERVVMIGDQLETDVAGAVAAGIDVALLAGISRWEESSAIVPTYLLESIKP
jgi:HAD superfamily hydrolase (TIGR01450 family)